MVIRRQRVNYDKHFLQKNWCLWWNMLTALWQFNLNVCPLVLLSCICSSLPRNPNTTHTKIGYLTLNPLMWKIWWAPNKASWWQMGFNSAFKGLIKSVISFSSNPHLNKNSCRVSYLLKLAEFHMSSQCFKIIECIDVIKGIAVIRLRHRASFWALNNKTNV